MPPLEVHSDYLPVPHARLVTTSGAAMPSQSVQQHGRFSYPHAATTVTIDRPTIDLRPGLGTNVTSRPMVGQVSDDEDERTIWRAVISIRQRGDKYKRRFLWAQKETFDLGLESAYCSREGCERGPRCWRKRSGNPRRPRRKQSRAWGA